MYRRLLLVTVLLSVVLGYTSLAQGLLPSPKYVPPDLATYGEEAHYRDMAIIETSGSSFTEIRDFWMELTRRGALIAVITSPQRMIGWVPRESYDNVLSTRLETATGDIRVLSISYTASEFRAKTVYRNSVMSETSEADETLIDFLAFVKRKKTAEELQRIREREMELRLLEDKMPPPNCVGLNVVTESDIRDMKSKAEIQGGPGAKIFRATKPVGLIAHTSFFLESKSGTGTWNWNSTVYLRYKLFYLVGISYWTSFAAKFGQISTGIWRLYGKNHSATQITGEPTTVGEDSFVPTVIGRLWSGTVPTWSGIRVAVRWCRPYNDYIRSTLGTDEAICGFIAYKGSGSESIWPHAESICWGGCDIEKEGVYFALDTQYWQAGHNPFDAPQRNVFAHEIGHLWGSPDEYASGPGCFNSMYRGIGNINCQRNQPARGRPGLTMTGFDGMMKANYLGGYSIAQPVHTGVRSAANASPIRCFMTQPANIPVTVKNCDDYGNRTYNTTMCLPSDFDYCVKVRVPLTRTISGTTYYFDKWRVSRKNGATTTFTNYANELPSSAWTSTMSNPVVTVRAIFTNSPPDFKSANTTLSAWLAPNSNAALPGRAIALKWRNKFDMSRVETRIEYERTPGNWVQLDIANMTLRPFRVAVGQWTGVHIVSTPTSSGGNMPIQVNKTYKFRVVGYFNTIRGTASNTASVTTRPETPADTVFCYDSYEPNTISSPKTLPSSGPGMVSYTVKAACPITPRANEFSWYVPKKDYYRITVINVSNTYFGEKLRLTLRVRNGSNFKPRFRAQRVGTTSHLNASYYGGAYHLSIGADGEYIIKVEPRISSVISYDLVDRTQGHFGFGEYEMTVERKTNDPLVILPCTNCVKLALQKPLPGLMISDGPFKLFDKGLDVADRRQVTLLYDPPPGFEFDHFEGDFGDQDKNPFILQIEPKLKPGEYKFNPVPRRLPKRTAELVIVNPDGPGGPVQRRITAPVGTTVNAQANAPADYVFIGWGWDTTATTNPLPVTLWRSKKIKAYFRKKPCVPAKMIPWKDNISFENSRQGKVSLEYGMQPGAGDGLEAGQVDLPPIPPVGTFDIRWINIPGSQGSTTDIRAVKQSHIYQGRVQTGNGTAPVKMSWNTPILSTDYSITLKIAGVPGSIDMHSAYDYTFTSEGTYIFTIEVKAKTCPPPANEPEVDITTTRIDPSNFPCIRLELLVKNRATGEVLPYYNPYNIKVYEKNKKGENVPPRIRSIEQNGRTLVYQLCSNREDEDPVREIVIVNDNDDPNTKKDTTEVEVKIPVPDDQGKLTRIMRQNSGDWEMVSLPVKMDSSLVSSLYPDPTTKLYRFNTTTGHYEATSQMQFGDGYWLKTPDEYTTFYGNEILSHTWTGLSGIGEPYGYGWNMIGSLSKSLAVSAIQVTPAGAMKSIFGWDPSAGYVVPTTIDPGLGYWVRLDPGATLKMQTSGFTGGVVSKTAYQRVSEEITLAGYVTVSSKEGVLQTLYLSAEQLEATEIDVLQLPIHPPPGLPDVRTERGTKYAVPGTNEILLQGDGEMTLVVHPVRGAITGFKLFDSRGELLYEYSEGSKQVLTLDVRNGVRLQLEYSARVPEALHFSLNQNFPNPFPVTAGTNIPYELENAGFTEIEIYDILGRKVRTLISSNVSIGKHAAYWDGRTDGGQTVTPGLYVVQLTSGTKSQSMILSVVK